MTPEDLTDTLRYHGTMITKALESLAELSTLSASQASWISDHDKANDVLLETIDTINESIMSSASAITSLTETVAWLQGAVVGLTDTVGNLTEAEKTSTEFFNVIISRVEQLERR